MAEEHASLTDLKVAGVWDGFRARLREIKVDCSSSPISMSGHFYYLAFRDGQPTVSEFVDFLYWQLIPFCIPRSEREECDRLYAASKNQRYNVELSDKAKGLFVAAKKSLKTSGEPGELILFMLLEAALQAPQIACKMYLKTAKNMPVHGSDAVHALYHVADDSLELIWGESKLMQQLPAALDAICKSIVSFLDLSASPSTRERDIDVILDHLDISNPQLEQALCAYFDPYEEKLNRRRESYACLAGFDFKADGIVAGATDTEIEEVFKKKYMTRIEEGVKLFEDKLVAGGLNSLSFHFFLLPFPSIKEVREAFFRKLGAHANPAK